MVAKFTEPRDLLVPCTQPYPLGIGIISLMVTLLTPLVFNHFMFASEMKWYASADASG